MTKWAGERDVAEAIERWSHRQVECRAYGHNWRSLTVFHRPGVYTITHRCQRCRNERQREIDEQGGVLNSWRFTYRAGYLLEGLGRLGADGKALLRLSNLAEQTIVEVRDEE